MQQDIGQLKVPVHSVDLMQTLEAIQHLLQEVEGLVLIELPFLLAVILQIPSVAELGGNEDRLVRGEGVNKLNHILTLNLLKDSYLGSYQLLQLWDLFHM